MRSVTLCVFKKQKNVGLLSSVFQMHLARMLSRKFDVLEDFIAGCCRGLTGFNKLGLSTHNAVTTPYIDLSSIIHTVTFVSYSRF